MARQMLAETEEETRGDLRGMKNYYKTHKNRRYSDSSQYDEVCEDCGLTDGVHAKKNMDNTPCTK